MRRGSGGRCLSAFIGILVGIVLISWPISGTLSLTIVMIAFFVVEGVTTLMYAIEHRNQLSGRWAWMLASGIVDLILAGIIFAGLPLTATWALGLLVGINMLFGGIAMIGMALAARQWRLENRHCERSEAIQSWAKSGLLRRGACHRAARLRAGPLAPRNDDYSAGCGRRAFSTPLAISAIASTATRKPSAMTAVAPSTRLKPPRP